MYVIHSYQLSVKRDLESSSTHVTSVLIAAIHKEPSNPLLKSPFVVVEGLAECEQPGSWRRDQPVS